MSTSDIFQSDRPRLFSIAYRMLGSASDAEDVLQDAWLRYSTADRDAVRSPQAFATTIVTRLCLDRLKSARATREQYIGPWLPEPVLTSTADGPDTLAQRAESVTLAFLVMLEQLAPDERAVLLLKDVFGYDHGEVAEMLGVSPENSRQLLHRAKHRLQGQEQPPRGTFDARRAVAERFTRAFATGDAPTLASLLRHDIGLWSDGGGKVSAARRPLLGLDEVVRFLVGLHRTSHRPGVPQGQWSGRIVEVNAEPALLIFDAGVLVSVFVLTVEDEQVAAIRVVRNPDKLGALARQLG
ncbi:MAG: RNA polymerase sigma factor SigJ [Vicinamibacterales bacterium]